MSNLVEAALEWAADGVPVFPCGVDKRPMTRDGFYDATTDPEQVRRLFELAGDNCYIGGRMGEESGLFACDFDIYKDGDAGASAQQYMAELIAKGVLPDTQRHRTVNGGLHLIFQSRFGYPNCKPVAGVEIKGEGGYIILPPSRGYLIEQDVGFREAPKALIDMLMRARRQHTDKTIQQHEENIIAGRDFHDSITSIAAKMFRRGASAADINKRIQEALSASVASAPEHPRHERWKALKADTQGEISRILNSGREKYDARAKTDFAKDTADAETVERIRKAAQDAGFAPSPEQQDATHDESPAKEYNDGEWPFAGEGYFAGESLNVADQRFNIFPIYAERESVVIAADPKAGKTAISLKLAIQLAAGRGLGPFQITDPRGVLYFALEGTRAIKLRIEAEKRRAKDNGEDLPDNMPLFVVERPTNFVHAAKENVAKVVAAARYFETTMGFPLGLVVIDTLTKAMPGADQNSVDDTSALFDFTTQLRAAGVTATVVFVHHTGKDGKTRGSSNIEAEVDVVLKMKKQTDGSTMMFVHMARSIDDNRQYRFELSSYSLGETLQGIEQSAPVVTLSEGNSAVEHSSEDAARASKIAPWLKCFIMLGGGVFTLKALYEQAKKDGLIEGRARKAELVKVLDLIFDRDAEVTYQGHIISYVKDKGEYSTIKIREPGVQ